MTESRKSGEIEKKWTLKEVCEHIKVNSNDTYSMAIVLSALYLKLYGERPSGIGLSGCQAECAEYVVSRLPDGNNYIIPKSDPPEKWVEAKEITKEKEGTISSATPRVVTGIKLKWRGER